MVLEGGRDSEAWSPLSRVGHEGLCGQVEVPSTSKQQIKAMVEACSSTSPRCPSAVLPCAAPPRPAPLDQALAASGGMWVVLVPPLPPRGGAGPALGASLLQSSHFLGLFFLACNYFSGEFQT